MAVTGKVHPNRIITNSAAKQGDILILTKPIGAGVIMAAHRIDEVEEQNYKDVLESMKQLNKAGSSVMQDYEVKCATDITGFGLLGHALKLSQGSGVSIRISSNQVPIFNQAYDLIEWGCIPGACFRNLDYVEDFCFFSKGLDYNNKMLLLDAQTSGGLLICCPKGREYDMVKGLIKAGYSRTAIVGEVIEKSTHPLFIV
jgi:selenide,water dikinase